MRTKLYANAPFKRNSMRVRGLESGYSNAFWISQKCNLRTMASNNAKSEILHNLGGKPVKNRGTLQKSAKFLKNRPERAYLVKYSLRINAEVWLLVYLLSV